MIRYFNS